ncbi:dedicator of cytokinesis [Naegleria gruberi]|uniref:Dedicator of cytokinesis n=1 Tax=Naegleria gruberi TaxID=5762 RepID=D2VV30_NAEGR|nr:dedicator of cytokinesis [Naegleria gruberi]EFC39369.1 dedicator of cytokinesis [Naegleria gruberi]|eukprot:XP_002672113.1 dedicator of cytokinesis [Naegleria gruberi strain NEG-M]
MDSARSTPHVNIARLGHHQKDTHSQFNDITVSDEGTTAEDTLSVNGVPMNVDEIFHVYSVENNPTISMTGYADTYMSSFSNIKNSTSEDKNLFGLQCLPNIFQPLYYKDNDNSAYGFSEIKKVPLLSQLSEQEVSDLPVHARKTIKNKYESPFLVLLSNSKKQHHLSRSTLKKFSVSQTKKQLIEDTKWRMFEDAMLSKEVRFHNDPNTSSSNPVSDYILPSGKNDKTRNRSDSGGLLTLKTLSDFGGKPSTSPSTSPTVGSPLTLESMFKRKQSDYASSPNTDDTSSLSSMKGYDSSSEEEESFQIANFSPRIIQEIPHGFLATRLDLLKDYMKESCEENTNVSLKKNVAEYKVWKKEHSLLEFLSDDLMNTHELKTKLFPFMYAPNENLKDGSSDILLQNFYVNKQDVDNRAKLIIDIEKFKLDFVEEHLNGVPLENFYASLTLYSVKLTESQNPSISAVKRYSETFSFNLSSSSNNSKRALFYLSSQNLPNSTAPNTEKVFVLVRIFRNFKGTYAEHFNELYIKGKNTPKSSSDKPFNVNDSKDYKAIKAVKPAFFESLKDVYSAFAWSIVELNPMLNSLPALQFPSLYMNGEGLSNDFYVKNIYCIPDKLVGNVSDDKLFEVYFANGLNLIPNVAEVSAGESGISGGLSTSEKTLVVNSGKDIIKQLSKTMLRSIPSKLTFKLMLLPPSKSNQTLRASLFENEKQYQYVQRKYLPENNMLVIQKESVTDQVEKKKKNRDDSKETLQADLPVTEMEQFYSSNTMPESTTRQTNLRNELYIYPQSANFSKFAVKNKNIQITVSYNDTDQNFSLNNMEQRNKGLFYKPFTSNNSSDRINEGECVSVALKNEKPEFSDEIKCIIPCRYPTEDEDCRQHLVFKFYNVSHKETIQKKASDVELSQSRTLIGVSFLKVYKKVTTTIDKRKIILKDLINGDFELPVYPVLNIPNANYLRLCDQIMDPSLVHIKPSATFKVKIIPYSFILPNIALTFPYSTSNIINLFLLKFFRLVNNTVSVTPTFEEIADVYKTLIQTYEYEKQVVSNTIWFEMHALYLPMILNTCFDWIIDTFGKDKNYTTELWKIILFFIEKYNQHSASSSTVLKIYQKYHFRFSKSGDDVIFKLISSFIDSIKIENSKLSPKGNVFEELFLRNNQTIFGLFLKSIVCSMSYNTVEPFQVDNEFDNLHIMTKSSLNAIEQFTVMVLEMVERVSFKNEKHTILKSFLKSFAAFYSHLIAIYSIKAEKRFELAGLISKQEIIQYLLKFIESMGYLPSLYKLKNNDNDSKKSKEISTLVSESQLLMISELLLHFPSFELSLPPPISLLDSIIAQSQNAEAPISNFRDIHHFVFSSFAEYFVRTIYLAEEKEVRLKAILLFKEYVEKISRESSTVQLSEESQPDEQKAEVRSRIFTSQLLLEFFAKHMIEIFPEWKRNAESNQKKITTAIEELRRKISQVERDILAAQDSLNQAKQNKTKKSTEPEKKLNHLDVQLTTLKQLLLTKEKQLLEEFETTKTEKRMLLSVFVQITTNCDENSLRSLWKIKPASEDSNMYHDDGLHFSSKLLMIFQMCVQSFEYGGYSPLYHYFDRLYQKLPQNQTVKHSTPLNEKFSPAKSNPSISRSASDRKKGDDKPLTKMSLDGPMDVDSPVRSSPSQGANSGISKSDYIEKKITIERLISNETSSTIFQLFLKFMEDNAEFIQNIVRPGAYIDPKHLPPILENIVRTLLNLLRSNLSECLTISVLLYLRHVLSQHPFTAIFYNPQSEYGLLFSEELLRLSHSKLGSIRKHAAACFYLWIRFCFEENKGMTVPQIMVTLSLSRRLQSYTKITHNFLSDNTIGDESFDDSEGINALAHIEECIKLLPYFAIKDEAAPGSKFFKIRNKYGAQKGDVTDREVQAEDNNGKQKGERFHTAMVFFKKIENKADQKKFGQKVLEVLDQFHDLLSDLSKKLLSLVQDTMSIRATMIKRKQSETSTVTYDPFKTEELLYRISDNYSKLPELRLAWLEQLASYHKGLAQYEESAHCYLRILSLVFDYLDHQATKKFTPNSIKTETSVLEILPLSQFYSISPMLIEFKVNQTGIQTQSLLGGGNSKYDYMSDQSIVNYILKTIDSLELAECFEHCIMLYKLLIPIFESKYANFTQLHIIYDRLTQLYKKCSSFQSTSNSKVPTSPSDNETTNALSLSNISSLSASKTTENETDSRVYSFYYRVKFVGRAFGELDGKVYIYKMPKLFKLFKMKNKMLEIYGKDVEVVSKDEAGVVTADDELSTGSESNKKVIQINHVKPFLPTVDQMKILRKKFDDLNRLSNISTSVNSAPSTRGSDRNYKTILKKSPMTSSTSKLPTMSSDSLSPRNRSNSNSQPPLPTLRSNIKFKSDENLSVYNMEGVASPLSPRDGILSPSSPSKVSIPKLNLSKNKKENSGNQSESNQNAFQDMERFLYDKILSLNYFITRDSEFQRNMNLNHFFYEYSVAAKGADITQTYKKKILITTEEYFPNVMTRLEVAEEKEFTLSPIENSIEMIDTQVKKLETAMNSVLSTALGDVANYSVLGNMFNHSVHTSSHSNNTGTPGYNKRHSIKGGSNLVINLNMTNSLGTVPYFNDLNINPHTVSTLQMILQGSVQARVGEGPKKVVEIFLNREFRERWKVQQGNSDLITKLNERCFRFLLLCDRGVKLHSLIIHSQTPTATNNKDRILHAELEKGFHEVKSLFEAYLEIPTVRTFVPVVNGSIVPERVTNMKKGQETVETFITVTVQDVLNYPDLFYKHNNISYNTLQNLKLGKQQLTDPFKQISTPSESPRNADLLNAIRNNNRLSIPSTKMKEYLEQLSIPSGRSLNLDSDNHLVHDLLLRQSSADLQ